MKRFALALVLSTLAVPALADSVGTYLLIDDDNKKQTMTVSYKNDQMIRMDVAPDSYMLVNGSKVYMVTTQNGQTHAVDMDSLPKFALPKGKGGSKAESQPSRSKVVKTGRTETIAGVKGDVWEITDEDGTKHEAVLSTDRRVQGMFKAFGALARKMGEALGGDVAAQVDLAMKEASQFGTAGLLRADKQMVLQSVVEKSQPASYYQLPASAKPVEIPKIDPTNLQQMQELMKRMQQQQRD